MSTNRMLGGDGPQREREMLVEAVKCALRNMEKEFVDLSRLKVKEVENDQNAGSEEATKKLLERPYSYEFYHQMRSIWRKRKFINLFKDVVIQGEVDKRYQAISGLHKIPDFLLHRPGDNNSNFAVIEVKLATTSGLENIEDDFNKLVKFCNILHYKYFIEIILGNSGDLNSDGLKEKVRSWNSNRAGRNSVEIVVVLFNTDANSWQADEFLINWPMDAT